MIPVARCAGTDGMRKQTCREVIVNDRGGFTGSPDPAPSVVISRMFAGATRLFRVVDP